ncbi:PPOX class F420-dependent oxidoreductase [Amycolatopsis sp.]|jgi:PPOX class probable F420-dependent enzyme|uniref:PPOX class F420-dependent oxidoreductase n=1 Tax=Amycolatopsis sp. TaxID=37632 RepID=UPI0039C8A4CD
MTKREWWAFASAGTRTGKLAVVRADGTPHVTPIWFMLDETASGDDLVFTTMGNSLKAKAFGRNPRFSLCVDDDRPPFSYVQFTAEATLHFDQVETLRWATAIGGRYMGEDKSEDYGRRNSVPEEALVRARITKVVAYSGIAD